MLCLRNNTAVYRVGTPESTNKPMAGQRSSGFWWGELCVGDCVKTAESNLRGCHYYLDNRDREGVFFILGVTDGEQR